MIHYNTLKNKKIPTGFKCFKPFDTFYQTDYAFNIDMQNAGNNRLAVEMMYWCSDHLEDSDWFARDILSIYRPFFPHYEIPSIDLLIGEKFLFYRKTHKDDWERYNPNIVEPYKFTLLFIKEYRYNEFLFFNINEGREVTNFEKYPGNKI